jgi:hypothetical protein
MTTAQVTIQLYTAEGRQWATVTVEGQDDPHLVLAEAVKALGAELAHLYAAGTHGGPPMDLDNSETITLATTPGPVSVSNLLGMSDTLPHEMRPPIEEVETPPVAASPRVRDSSMSLSKAGKPRADRNHCADSTCRSRI